MTDNDCHLSDEKHGYDFVVAVTQASLDTELKSYLMDTEFPSQCLCLVKRKSMFLLFETISLEELQAKVGNIDPFEIAHQTNHNDKRVEALRKANFVAGIRIKPGLPDPDIFLPKHLPSAIKLGTDASKVDMALLFRKMTIVYGPIRGDWIRVDQDDFSSPWSLDVTVPLTTRGLTWDLETPYFNSRENLKRQLRKQLENVSQGDFTLHQTLYDLESANFKRLNCVHDDQIPEILMNEMCGNLLDLYRRSIHDFGQPVVAITTKALSPSPLQVTAMDLQVTPYWRSGIKRKLPSPLSTLDFLCMTKGKPLPRPSPFEWNWVPLEDKQSRSGMVAVNREALGEYLLRQVLRESRKYWLVPRCSVDTKGPIPIHELNFDGQKPSVPETAEVVGTDTPVLSVGGKKTIPDVIHVQHNAEHKARGYGLLGVTAEIHAKYQYSCRVQFSDTSILVIQRWRFYLYLERWHMGSGYVIRDTTATDTLDLSVDAYGNLQLRPSGDTMIVEQPDKPPSDWLEKFLGAISGLTVYLEMMKHFGIWNFSMKSIPLHQSQQFVFPGAKSFNYNSVKFSKWQDLLCGITYADGARAAISEEAMTWSTWANIKTEEEEEEEEEKVPPLHLSYSSDLMQNYIQGEVLAPRAKFEALQTQDGRTLLFTIDTDDKLHAIEELSGRSSTGWQPNDLSSSALATHFADMSARVRTFDAGQSAITGTISLAMVVTCDEEDYLLVSLGNSSDVTPWIQSPEWKLIPFDAAEQADNDDGIQIEGVFFTEPSSDTECLFVDLHRDGLIVRYVVNASLGSGSCWTKHDLPVSVNPEKYQTCVGRVSRGGVDGIYTAGSIEGTPQLVYVPVVNIYSDDAPPQSRRLALPGDARSDAIATARSPDKSTDLFVVSHDTLYRFAAKSQVDRAEGKPVSRSDIFKDTETLRAMVHDGVTTLWGLNANRQVYYLSCPTSQLHLPGSWSFPIPILDAVEHLTTFINCADGGNTVFGARHGELYQILQATEGNSKIWRAQKITLASHPQQPSLSFMSYTTTIQATDRDNKVATATPLRIAANSRTPAYINGTYYVLSQAPVEVLTDLAGAVTIIEATEDLNAAILTITTDYELVKLKINPMEVPLQRITALDSPKALRGASIPTNIQAGGVLSSTGRTSLIDPSANETDIAAVAASLGSLKEAYHSAPWSAKGVDHWACVNHGVIPATLCLASTSVGHKGLLSDIAVAAGDLFQWLRSGVESVVNLVRNTATGAWNFVVQIAGKVYNAVLDTVHAVVGAVKWIFEKIKTGMKSVWKYLQFLFEWDDIRRTKDVINHMAHLYRIHQVDQVRAFKATLDQGFDHAQEAIRTWEGLKDWSLPEEANELPSTKKNPTEGQTSGSQLLATHFRNNVNQMTMDASINMQESAGSDTERLAQRLLDALEAEGQVLTTLYKRVKDLTGRFHKTSIASAIKELVGILAEGLLGSVKVVVDVVLDMLVELIDLVLGILDVKIHIPVVSDILAAIGVPSFTLLELFGWIAATGYTVTYKIFNKHAPFSAGAETDRLLNAKSMADMKRLFGPEVIRAATEWTRPHTFSMNTAAPEPVPVTLRSHTQNLIYHAGHEISCILVFTNNIISTPEASLPFDNPLGKASGTLGFFAALVHGATDFLVPRAPIDDPVASGFSTGFTAAVVFCKLLFLYPFKCIPDRRSVGSLVNLALAFANVVPSIWHFLELGHKPPSLDRSAAIVDETANMTSYVSRICYSLAVNDAEPDTRLVLITIMSACNVGTSGLYLACAFIPFDQVQKKALVNGRKRKMLL